MKAKKAVTASVNKFDRLVLSGDVNRSTALSAKVKQDKLGNVRLSTTLKKADVVTFTAFGKLESEAQKLRRVINRLSESEEYKFNESWSKIKEAHFTKWLSYLNEQRQAIQVVTDLYNKEIAKYPAFVYNKDENPSGILRTKNFTESETFYTSLFVSYLANESMSVKAEAEKFSAEIRKAVDAEIASKMQDFASHVEALEVLSESKDEAQAEKAKAKLAYLRKIEAYRAKQEAQTADKLEKLSA